MPSSDVLSVAADDLFALRHSVLSPESAPASASRPGDDHPLAKHFAFRDTGHVIAAGSVFPEPADWDARPDAWRLRGMAVASGHRNRGLGTAILSAIIEYVAQNSGGLLWCTARIGARSLYTRAGFVSRGEIFDDGHGPHVVMWRLVGPQMANPHSLPHTTKEGRQG